MGRPETSSTGPHEGAVPPERLFDRPYTDLHASGIEGVFPAEAADQIIAILDRVRSRAVA